MNTEKVIAQAKAWLGCNEYDGSFRQIIDVYNSIGTGIPMDYSWPWCACFVSWVADQAGYIEKKIIPKFSGCQNGIDWFKAMGQWKDKGFIPKAGDIIFFDWAYDGMDGKGDHTSIVEKVENGIVYTIEGNSGDKVCSTGLPITPQVLVSPL